MSHDRSERAEVLVSVTRLLDDERVEAQLVDAAGEVWTFVDQGPVFGATGLGPGAIRCTVIRDEMVDGILLVHIDTADPDGVESTDGVSRFRVLRALVP